jgi:formylglycine-generating enzyme required for sulfatase activity
MRFPSFGALSVLLIASAASAVTMAWTPIGNPGNACDPQSQGCFGAVGYEYYIGTYEVTNAQYVEFLNAKAASDPLGLYNPNMADTGIYTLGGITRSGTSGSYTYATIAGRADMPVNNVSFFDALRFANWMNNGQGTADTESGSYTLEGGTPTPSNGGTVIRNGAATIVLPSENEWYKTAYYDAITSSYFDYPTGTNAQTQCAPPTALPNRANCFGAAGPNLTAKGSYSGSPSPYGTFDQGGNVSEWNETLINGSNRALRGGSFGTPAVILSAAYQGYNPPDAESGDTGFRLAMIPEPGTGLLVFAGLLGLAGWRRARARA